MRFRGILGNLLLLTAASAVGLLFVEISLRIVDYSRPPFWRYDADIGTTHRANTVGWYEREGMVKIRINGDGLRGPETPVRKPPNTFRIAILGDSFAEAFQVEEAQRFSNVAEHLLSSCPIGGKRAEVLNFGVSGYGQARQILMYRHRVKAYSPDLVLLLFHGGNDFRNNTKELERNPLNPYFVFDQRGNLVLDRGNLETAQFTRKLKWSNLRNDVVANIRLLQVVQSYLEYRVQAAEAEGANALAAKLGVDRNTSYVRTLATAPPASEMDAMAWHLTEAHFRLLADEIVRDTGRPLWVADVPPSLAVLPDPVEQARQLATLDLMDANYVWYRLEAFLRNIGVEFVPLTPALLTEARSTGADLHWHDHSRRLGGHWNAAAHRAAGTELAKALCPELSLTEKAAMP